MCAGKGTYPVAPKREAPRYRRIAVEKIDATHRIAFVVTYQDAPIKAFCLMAQLEELDGPFVRVMLGNVVRVPLETISRYSAKRLAHWTPEKLAGIMLGMAREVRAKGGV